MKVCASVGALNGVSWSSNFVQSFGMCSHMVSSLLDETILVRNI